MALVAHDGARVQTLGGIATDAVSGIALAEQRLKGIVLGVAIGATGAGVLAYMFGPEIMAVLGALPRRKNPSGCNSCGISASALGRKYKVGP